MKKIILTILMFIISISIVYGAASDNVQSNYKHDTDTEVGSVTVDDLDVLNVTIGGNTALVSTGIINQAYTTDGGSDYLYHDEFTISSDIFAINFWIKVNVSAQQVNSGFLTLCQQQEVSGSERAIDMSYNEGTNTIYFYVGTGTKGSAGSWDTALSYVEDLEDNEWRMLTYIYNFTGGYKSLYINGTQVTNQTSGLANYGNSNIDMSCMARQQTLQELVGTIDSFTIWDGRIPTNTEISEIYTNKLQYPFTIQNAYPTINNQTYNCTSCYVNQTVWRNGTFNQPKTNDSTTTVTFTASTDSNWTISKFEGNYTATLANDSNSLCGTTGTDITCTLSSTQALTAGDNCMYLAGIRADGNNQTSGSTSGCLNISMDYLMKGTTKNQNGVVLENAFITIQNELDNATKAQTWSNSTGGWSALVGRGTYTVSAFWDIGGNVTLNGDIFSHVTIP